MWTGRFDYGVISDPNIPANFYATPPVQVDPEGHSARCVTGKELQDPVLETGEKTFSFHRSLLLSVSVARDNNDSQSGNQQGHRALCSVTIV